MSKIRRFLIFLWRFLEVNIFLLITSKNVKYKVIFATDEIGRSIGALIRREKSSPEKKKCNK